MISMYSLDDYLLLTKNLYDQVKGDEVLQGKLYRWLESTIPQNLDAALSARTDREARQARLRTEAARFIVRFLARHPIYYTPQNELFVRYTGRLFEPCSEDTLAHKAISAINAEGKLLAWKHRVKNTIVKKVRERSPLSAIPESATIQLVLSFFVPSVFSSRDGAKYFLCCLGDGWRGLCGEQAITVIGSPALKRLVSDLAALSNSYFAHSNPFNHIKFKFHEHEFRTCRLLPRLSVEEVSKAAIWTIGKHTLEVMSVACHYSERYSGSDGFLERACDHEFRESVLYLVDRTPPSIVGEFVLSSLEVSEHMSISQQDMLYLWKQYLHMSGMPTVVFNGTFHSLLRDKIGWDEETRSYLNVTSPELPWVSAFRQFWANYIVDAEEDDELEIEEIVALQHEAAPDRRSRVRKASIVDLIRHQDPHSTIEQDKFVIGIKSPLWNKRADVLAALDAYRAELPTHETGTLGEAYACYVQSLANQLKCVSKRYFDKVAMDSMADYLDEDGVFSSEWNG